LISGALFFDAPEMSTQRLADLPPLACWRSFDDQERENGEASYSCFTRNYEALPKVFLC
jgi:hypothetical protein